MSQTASRIFYLWYDRESGRYMKHNYGLHCGDGLTVQIDSQWIPTRIEHTSDPTKSHSHGWYLVTHPDQPIEDLPVQ